MVKNGKATQKTTPIPSNPELVVVSERVGNGEWINEYRVYNFRSLPSSRIRKDDSVGLLGWVVVGIILWMVKDLQWHDIISGKGTLLEVSCPSWNSPLLHIVSLSLFVVIWSRIKTYQSITPIKGIGLQHSTTRYISLFPTSTEWNVSTSKSFIPLSDISTIVINEGPYRWSIRYHLVIILKRGRGVRVCFDVVQPRHVVLKEVYHEIRETLFDEFADDLT